MVKKTNLIYVLFVALVLILLAWVVMAAELGSLSMAIVTPISGANISGTFNFNVTFTNGTDITSPQNITIYENSTGAWVKLGESGATDCISRSASCNISLSTTSLGDGIYNFSINATLDNGTDLASVGDANNISVEVTFDNTPPIVFDANITSPKTESNNSGTLVLNVSIVDVTLLVDVVFFNITNSIGVQNATSTAVNTIGADWNVTIDTKNFPDGNYTITIFANDTTTGGNLNSSALVYNVTFDNTKPTVSVSCTPNPVTQDDTITCTCTRSDATSGVKTVSHDTTPSTTQTGTFTNECTVTDHAGNSASGSFDYNVEGAGGGTTGGGTTGTGTGTTTTGAELSPEEWTQTFDETDSELSDKGSVNKELGELERVTFLISGEIHHVGVVSLTGTSAMIEIASHAGQVEFSVGDSREFDVDEDGTFYDLRVTLVSIDASKANVMVEYIQEEIPQPPEPTPPTTPEEAAGLGALFWVLIIVVVIIVIVIIFWMRKREA